MNPIEYTNKLLHGETLTVLKELPESIIDLGITSPPYNKQEKNNGGLVKHVIYADYKDAMPEEVYQKNQMDVLNELYRITKEGGSFFYNHKIRWVNGEMYHPMDWIRKTNWCVRQEIIWDRTIAGNIRGWRFWQVDERIYWLYKPIKNNKKGRELESQDAKMTSIWRGVPENNNPHPAPFPLWLPVRIIVSLIKDIPQALIIDPYMGSGTTAVASKLLGYHYIGIEISKHYIDFAESRIKNCEKERIHKEIELHKIIKTYSQRKEDKALKKSVRRNECKYDKEQGNLFENNCIL